MGYKKGGKMSFSKEDILWIEDDLVFLESTKMLFKPMGLYIRAVTNGLEGINLIKKYYFNFFLVLLDLDMPDMSGIEVFQAIRRINPRIPIIFVSAHIGEPQWENKIKALNVEINQIAKPFPVITSKDFMAIENIFKKEKKRYQEELINPFKYSYEEFMNLPNDEIDKLFEEAAKINSIFVEEYFQQNTDIDWVVIAESPGNIISYGKYEDEPCKDELDELAKKYDAPVFIYSRPMIIEKIDINSANMSFYQVDINHGQSRQEKGIDAIKTVRKNDSDALIVVSSPYPDKENECIDAGADLFFKKAPGTHENALTQIRNLIIRALRENEEWEKVVNMYSQIVDIDEERNLVRLNCKLEKDSEETFERVFPLSLFKNSDKLTVNQSIHVQTLERAGEIRFLFENTNEDYFEEEEDIDISDLDDSPIFKTKDT
jgi:CheY-like chemotaxis protein